MYLEFFPVDQAVAFEIKDRVHLAQLILLEAVNLAAIISKQRATYEIEFGDRQEPVTVFIESVETCVHVSQHYLPTTCFQVPVCLINTQISVRP